MVLRHTRILLGIEYQIRHYRALQTTEYWRNAIVLRQFFVGCASQDVVCAENGGQGQETGRVVAVEPEWERVLALYMAASALARRSSGVEPSSG